MSTLNEAKAALRRAAIRVETATTALHPNGLDRAHAEYLAAYEQLKTAERLAETERWTA